MRGKLQNLGHLCGIFSKRNDDFNILRKQTKKELRKHRDNAYKREIISRVRASQYLTGPYSEIDEATQFINEQSDLVYIRLEKITTINGWSYGSDREPLTTTAEELIQNPKLHFRQTTLHRFYKAFQPKTFAESFFIEGFQELDTILPYYYFRPWIHSKPSPHLSGELFGPKHDSNVQHRVYRMINLIELLSKYSYIPTMDDIITGYVLKRADDFRLVLSAGHHRMAVISALARLGFVQNDRLLVKIDKMHAQKSGGEIDQNWLFDRQDSKRWPAVALGYISEKGALKIFDSFFCDQELSVVATH